MGLGSPCHGPDLSLLVCELGRLTAFALLPRGGRQTFFPLHTAYSHTHTNLIIKFQRAHTSLPPACHLLTLFWLGSFWLLPLHLSHGSQPQLGRGGARARRCYSLFSSFAVNVLHEP